MGTWWIDKPHLLGSSNPTDADLEEVRSDGFPQRSLKTGHRWSLQNRLDEVAGLGRHEVTR